MNFIKKFDRQTQDQHHQPHILTDGQNTCSYGELETIFHELDAFFLRQGITVAMPLVLECENTLPAALTLLYLLQNNYSFVLLPSPCDASSLPPFCRFCIKICGEKLDAGPDSYLCLIVNKKWNGKAADDEGKLYLRTSGSTGVPKLVVHSHRKLRQNALNCLERLQLDENDRIAIPVPIFHMFGLGAAFLPAVMAGASVDLQKGANLLKYLPRERAFNPNVAFMTPIFCETLLKVRRTSRPYRLTVTAGDRFRGEGAFARYEALFGTVVNLYGSTEMGAMSVASPDDSFENRSETACKPLHEVALRIKNSDTQTGELLCRHAAGFRGYADLAGNRADSPESEKGWFPTKDIGQILPDGRIKVMGRQEHCVNRDGLLVFFADVETSLKGIEAVENAVVIAKGESSRGKGMIACCVPAQGSTANATDIRKVCLDILPARAVPDQIVLLDELPMLPSGKIDRKQIEQII